MGRISKGILWAAVLVGVLFFAWTTGAKAADIPVTSKDDSGQGSLREALLTGPGSVIRFDPAVFPPGSQTVISVTSPLPLLQQGTHLLGAGTGVIIDGSLAPDGTDGLVVAGPSVEVSDLTVKGFKGNGIVIGANARAASISRTDVLSNTLHGIVIRGSNNQLEQNVVSGNGGSGVRIEGAGASGNLLDRSTVGLSPDEKNPMGNGHFGIEITGYAHDNLIGQSQRGNTVAANRESGIVLGDHAHHNRIVHNRIGMNTNRVAFPNDHVAGGILVVDGAHDNTIGGLPPADQNLIGGAGRAGIVVGSTVAEASSDNEILGNAIGWLDEPQTAASTAATANAAGLQLPNNGHGILIGSGAQRTRIELNTISSNKGQGVEIVPCASTTVARNSIFGNDLAAIHYERACTQPAAFDRLLNSFFPYLRFKTTPGARVEFFYDDVDEGRVYVGSRTADTRGYADYLFSEDRPAPNITVTSTDKSGNTSELASIQNIEWTVLLYLNGDNDLETYMDVVLNDLSRGERPQANILALVDTKSGENNGETSLYDLSGGRRQKLKPYWGGGELNMGDGKTLEDFVNYGFGSHAALHEALIILDHGGGWAPPNPVSVNAGPALPRDHRYLAGGGSGLSWDDSSNSDYLDSVELRDALRRTGRRMDVLFYDVCVMGMAEVAYQVRDLTHFFVSSQNLGWAPDGDPTRYWKAMQSITASTTPREFARSLVDAYGATLPPYGRPYTIAAVDTSGLSQLASTMTRLGEALRSDLANQGAAQRLRQVYLQTQKVDYNTNLLLEPDTEGYVDLYDLASKLTAAPNQPANVIAAAQAVLKTKDAVVAGENHRNGRVYMDPPDPEHEWKFDGLNGLSVYLPFGEDAMLHVGTPPTVADIPLRNTYTCSALAWVCDTRWDTLIRGYYDLAGITIPSIPARQLDKLRGPLPPTVSEG